METLSVPHWQAFLTSQVTSPDFEISRTSAVGETVWSSLLVSSTRNRRWPPLQLHCMFRSSSVTQAPSLRCCAKSDITDCETACEIDDLALSREHHSHIHR